MQLSRLKMVDRVLYKIGAVATFFGLCAQQAMAVWLALPWALQTFLQGLITLGFFASTLVVGHFLRRFLHRNYPIEAPGQNVASPQSEAIVLPRVGLFGLVRRLFAFVRSAMSRRRKGS